MTYTEAVRYLYSLGNEVATAKFDLERITRLLEALGNPQRQGRFVHVAGTNGKGSTSAMIENGLRAAGQRTGLFTSPHLSEPTERIRVCGVSITEEQFAAAFEIIHDTSEKLLRAGELDLHPTYFETVTAMAFLIFAQAALDRVVLEVGMGGRLDATNVVTPELCVITPIALDHQSFLGGTRSQIAEEKAGILKPGAPAVFAAQDPEAEAVLLARAQGPYVRAEEWRIEELAIDPRHSRFRIRDIDVVCPLAGEHQVENARTAAIALNQLGIGPAGIAQTQWPGRLERVGDSPEIILDGAHNPAGTRALVAYIQRFYAGRNIWLVYGVMRDKAIDEMAAMLFPLACKIIATQPDNSRALPSEKIPAPEAVITHTVAEAIQLAKRAPPGDAVFITGSLFVVGEARALLVQ
jgi:dihydrofolate synthase/folylpolyglutamate synthase